MAGTSPPAGLLDRAGRVFSLAHQLYRDFHNEHSWQGERGRVNSTGWQRHEPAFETFCAAVLELRDAIQNPPDGFASVAKVLMEAARVAKQIRDTRQTVHGTMWAMYLEFWPHLNSVALDGQRALREVLAAQERHDPFAFLDQPAPGNGAAAGIDTTPPTPQPPKALVEAAERAIPAALANEAPQPGGAIELIAATLVKRLQDANHTLAAAQWATHAAVGAGRLKVGRVEVFLPQVIVPERRAQPERFFGTHARNTPARAPEAHTGTKPIPKGQPAPFDCFKVVATDALWAWWHSLESKESQTNEGSAAIAVGVSDQGPTFVPTVTPAASSAPVPKTKRSTSRGDGRVKLIAALTSHHQYAKGGSLNLDPINNNELARQAEVATSTASAFFLKEFGGYNEYRSMCQDGTRLVVSLKLLNDEFAPHHLFGSKPSAEDDRDDE